MPILEVNHLTKKYKDFKAVDDISFSVEKGSIFAFLGPNGAGKSTTIKMLTTITTPTSGSIILAGTDALRDKNGVRKHFGIVFQDQSLDEDLTALENLQYHAALYHVPKNERERRIQHALKIVELLDRQHDLVKKYSGGMKRRLEIARGLIHEPSIIFLDEPTTGLDPQTRNSIWEHIKKLNKEKQITIFMTTHYMPEAEEVADHVAVIDHGKIIIQGSTRYIKEKTHSKDLEAAFLKLTGHAIRDENASAQDNLRQMARLHRR